MIYTAKIHGQFETVAGYSAHYEQNWQACLSGLRALNIAHRTFAPGEFPGVEPIYPKDSDIHTRFIHYWTPDEELSHSLVVNTGFQIYKAETMAEQGAAVLQLVRPEIKPTDMIPTPQQIHIYSEVAAGVA